jgi:hypothetical protein
MLNDEVRVSIETDSAAVPPKLAPGDARRPFGDCLPGPMGAARPDPRRSRQNAAISSRAIDSGLLDAVETSGGTYCPRPSPSCA